MYTAFTYQDTFTLGLDAMLSVYFVATEGQATVAGIEIMLPAVLRIDAGSTSSFSDELAPSPREWQADDFFTGRPLPGCSAGSLACPASTPLHVLARRAAIQNPLCDPFLDLHGSHGGG